MNNDTPQVFGEDTHGYPHSSGGEEDGEDFPAFRGWTGWGDRVEPVAPDEDYPQPSFPGYEPSHEPQPWEPQPWEPQSWGPRSREPRSWEPQSWEDQAYEPQPSELGYSREPGYPDRPGPGQPGYPAGPGYAPESGYERGLAYAPGMSYAPGVSYARDYGYPRELGFAEDPGYGADVASGPEAAPVPPMEQLPDPELAAGPEPVADPGPPADQEPVVSAAPVPVSAPVAALPQEATQSWDPAQDWEADQSPGEGQPWQEGQAWPESQKSQESQESQAWPQDQPWHEPGPWQESGPWQEGEPVAVPLPTRVPLGGQDGRWTFGGPRGALPSVAEPPVMEPPVMEPPVTERPVIAPPAAEPPAAEPSGPEVRPDGPEYARETSASLTSESLLHGKRPAPGSGWRRSVYRASGGLLRFGESAAEMRRRDLISRVRTPVAGGHHRVAVLSLKGGVGKTTTAVGLGATLATLRGDRVIAVDANPDRGTLSDKVRLETAATIRDLLNERGQVGRYADVRAFTSQAPSRLEVLASDRDPAVSVAFGAEDYSDVAQLLEHFYSIAITDCGTGLLHSAMSGVLALADQIVLVSSPSVDGARSASATLDWLEAHGCGDLVRNGVVVLSAIRPKTKSTVDLDRLEHHFAARCRAVARIPYDPHLEEGAEIELELLGSDTAEAYLALAAVVGDGLAWPRRRGG